MPHNVYYLTGHLTFWQHHAAMILYADERAWLATANAPAKDVAADQVMAYEANWMGTLRQEQPAVLGGWVHDQLIRHRASRVALEAFMKRARLEGIIPSLESAHAIAECIVRAPKMSKDALIIVNLSGRGDKDVAQAADKLGLQMPK